MGIDIRKAINRNDGSIVYETIIVAKQSQFFNGIEHSLFGGLEGGRLKKDRCLFNRKAEKKQSTRQKDVHFVELISLAKELNFRNGRENLRIKQPQTGEEVSAGKNVSGNKADRQMRNRNERGVCSKSFGKRLLGLFRKKGRRKRPSLGAFCQAGG